MVAFLLLVYARKALCSRSNRADIHANEGPAAAVTSDERKCALTRPVQKEQRHASPVFQTIDAGRAANGICPAQVQAPDANQLVRC